MNPCIADTNCIDLDVDVSSNLIATLKISSTPGNGAECRPDGLFTRVGTISPEACNGIEDRVAGLWAGDHIQQSFGVAIGETTTGSYFGGSGEVIIRSGTLNWNNPATCGAPGIIVASFNFGPMQINNLSPGGRALCGFQKHTGGGYVGGPYCLDENTGGSSQDFAWPGAWTTTIDPIGGGASGTIYWKQTIEVTAGSVGSFTLRPIFIYAWVVAMS